jgi:hypothetical protein
MTPQAYTAQGSYVPPANQQPQIDPALLATLNNPQLPGGDWHMDTGAYSHMASDPGNFHSLFPSSSQFVTVGNGATLPVTHVGSQTLNTLTKPLYLCNILLVPKIIKNLISVSTIFIRLDKRALLLHEGSRYSKVHNGGS